MKAKSFAVLGLGNFGKNLAETIAEMGFDVLAVDRDEEEVNNISANVTHAIVGDVMDENFIKSMGLRNFDAAIVAIGGEVHSSVLLTLMLKEEGVKRIVARAQSELHSRVLRKVGADKVVFPEKDMGVRVAHNLISYNVLDIMELSPEYSVVEVIPPGEWTEKSIRDSDIRAEYGVSIIAIRNNEYINVAPKADYVIKPDDQLIIIGKSENIKKIGNK